MASSKKRFMETENKSKASSGKKGNGDQSLTFKDTGKEVSAQQSGEQHVYMNQESHVEGQLLNSGCISPPALPPRRRMSDDPLTRREKPPALPPRNAGSASKAEGLSCGFVNTRRGGFSGSPKKWKDERERVSRTGRIACVPPALQEKSAPQTLSLLEFVKKYSNSLPAQVSVEKGHYGLTDLETLGNQEKLTISFVKSRKVLNIVTSTQQKFALPLGSALQLSLLYNPDGNECRALKGYTFQSVGELVRKSPNLPRVICATQACRGDGLKSTVFENELLVVENYNVQTKRLQVISLGKNPICKFLPLQCSGCFTTKPSSVRMYVSDICNYMGIPRCALYGLLDLSEVAVLAVDTHIDQSLYSIVKLAGFVTEKSLIGTRMSEEGLISNTQPKAFFKIPVNDNLSGVAVTVIQTNMTTDGQLPQPSIDCNVKLEAWYQEGSTASSKFQRFLDDYVRHGHEGEGISINAASVNIYELVDSQPSQSSRNKKAEQDEIDNRTADNKDEPSAVVQVKEPNIQQSQQGQNTDSDGAYDNTCDNDRMSLTRTELEATVRAIVNELISDEKQCAMPEKGMGGHYYTSMDWQVGKFLVSGNTSYLALSL